MHHLGYGFIGVPCDVTDFDACKACVAQVEKEVGPVDVLVNNAGITRDMTFKKMTKADWDAVLHTNLDSIFNMTKQVMDGMVARKWGRVINVSIGEWAERRVRPDQLFGGQSWHARVHESPGA